jgi:NAD-dependent SIR2 family protein deacetylase
MQSGRAVQGKHLFSRRALSDVFTLALLNRKLAEQRDAAAAAAPTHFHRLLDHLYNQKTLQRCYTENSDCLEGRLTPAMMTNTTGPAVIQLLGSNDSIKCDTCNMQFPASDFQTRFLAEVEVECPACVGK